MTTFNKDDHDDDDDDDDDDNDDHDHDVQNNGAMNHLVNDAVDVFERIVNVHIAGLKVRRLVSETESFTRCCENSLSLYLAFQHR